MKRQELYLDDAPIEIWLTWLREIARLDLALARQEQKLIPGKLLFTGNSALPKE